MRERLLTAVFRDGSAPPRRKRITRALPRLLMQPDHHALVGHHQRAFRFGQLVRAIDQQFFAKLLRFIEPRRCASRRRMRMAAEALEKTDKSVVEVAMDVGYNSEAAFNRAFKRTYNFPPAQFRQQKKSEVLVG